VTSFSVASSRKYKTSVGEQREETEWFNVSSFGKLAEICNQYLSKGKQVYLEGGLKTRSYEARNGETRFSLEVIPAMRSSFLVVVARARARVKSRLLLSKIWMICRCDVGKATAL